MSKFFKPGRALVAVTFLVLEADWVPDEEGFPPDPVEVERTFELREGLRPHAAAFLHSLENLRMNAGDTEKAIDLLDGIMVRLLRFPTDGQPAATREEVAGLTPSVQIALLDEMGVLYGFTREESRLGKQLAPLLELLHQHRVGSDVVKMMRGPSSALSLPEPSESTPKSPSDDGPGESSTTTTECPSENAGESDSSNSSSPG